MQIRERLLAKKYAIALFNLYEKEIQEHEREVCLMLCDFFNKHRYFYLTLCMPSIPISEKEKVVDILLHSCDAGKPLIHLIHTLIEDGRGELIVEILQSVALEYNKRHTIEFFTVLSSHALNNNQKDVVIKFIKSMTNATPEVAFALDPDLIVGLRIQSTRSLWERSIRKELMELDTILVRKGISC